ncbi:hypothetical protein ALO71_102697 [Pseudomonas amygdali pv. dendropanacis]|uniref:Uncharacterized protein n=1 Tax=Pseudomonas amygdali pv. dendropanacis TaxID=235272 RepID=A0A0P9QZQ6_PSEA0|nr:hypothetical protein PSYAE_20003 [Pseudomonas amygdali pv. aesculi str. 0893_23]KPW22544.1 hypothetical protein ALO90_102954 [Pseudomonas amygdali pv. aesculi]KPX21163.1 hypothetical protein ALO71_102697 [Pseudomonas amygdali pv. dendropanacis]RMO94377.1 hypothetical protein ALQ31_100838 [Pseudomonas amygdali pv. morsprunorum]RMU36062.1 hypothetical protein ALP31_103117 [Pseudomonas amygdali pv. morsprunorum]
MALFSVGKFLQTVDIFSVLLQQAMIAMSHYWLILQQ